MYVYVYLKQVAPVPVKLADDNNYYVLSILSNKIVTIIKITSYYYAHIYNSNSYTHMYCMHKNTYVRTCVYTNYMDSL